MWKCPKCRESVEGSFGVCWNCVTSRDGVEDPTFQRAEEDPGAGDAQEVRPEDAIQAGLPARTAAVVAGKCPHCGGAELIRGVSMGLTAETGTVGLKHRALLILVGTEP